MVGLFSKSICVHLCIRENFNFFSALLGRNIEPSNKYLFFRINSPSQARRYPKRKIFSIFVQSFCISLGIVYSAARIAFATAIVSWTDRALIHILPFIPAASSYIWFWPSNLNNGHSGLSNFLTRLSEQVNIMPSELSTPRSFSLPCESTHTNSGSMSLLATSSLAYTRSPTCTSGRFFFVAPSKAR